MSTTENYYAGKRISLINAKLYSSFSSKVISDRITGDFYIYEGTKRNNRIRITEDADSVGKPCACTGWVNLSDIVIYTC